MTSNSKTSNNWIVSLRPFIAFAICLGSAFFKTGTRVIVKHLDFVNPILLNCVQYLVLAILSQPIAVCRGKILEPPFQRNQRIMLFLRVLVGVIPNAINFYALQVNNTQRAKKLKKVQAKKLVKSNKSNFFFVKLHFLQF